MTNLPPLQYGSMERFHHDRGTPPNSPEYDFGLHRREHSIPDHQPGTKPPAWRIAVIAGTGDVYAGTQSGPGIIELLGVIRLPLPKTPEINRTYCLQNEPDLSLRREPIFQAADKIFRGWADAGANKSVEWFRERLRRHGCAPSSQPEDRFLTPQEASDYGLPWQVHRSRIVSPTAEFNPHNWPALEIPREPAHYNRMFILYRPPPGFPMLLRAYEFTHQVVLPTNPNAPTTTENQDEIDPELRKAQANSRRRHQKHNLRRAKILNAGPRRRRERYVRQSLNLHPDWGIIGPFPHAQSRHTNWFRKEKRDQARRAQEA